MWRMCYDSAVRARDTDAEMRIPDPAPREVSSGLELLEDFWAFYVSRPFPDKEVMTMTKLPNRYRCDRDGCPVTVIPPDSETALKIPEDGVTCAGTDRLGKQWGKDFCSLQCYVEWLVDRFQQSVVIHVDASLYERR